MFASITIPLSVDRHEGLSERVQHLWPGPTSVSVEGALMQPPSPAPHLESVSASSFKRAGRIAGRHQVPSELHRRSSRLGISGKMLPSVTQARRGAELAEEPVKMFERSGPPC